jgi:adenylosuccinate lyase
MLERYSLPEMREIWSERSRLQRWLEVEIAVVEAWAELGVIPPSDAAEVREKATFDIEAVREREKVTRHDVAAFVDVVAESCGAAGRWLHYGLTSSDVLDTALATQLRDTGALIRREAVRYFETLKARALEFSRTPCVGRTHGMHAEPTTFGAKLASYAFEILRFLELFDHTVERAVVGKIAGAVGTYSTVLPEVEAVVCRKLGIRFEDAPSQIVARDRIAAFVGSLAIGAAAVERFATEIRHLQRTEVAEVEEPFGEGQKGSSAMPHKRNPVGAERLCGLARTLRAAAMATTENIALWHERDISHSSVERMTLPDACATFHFMLVEASRIAEGMRVDPQRMLENLEASGGAIFSQRVMLALVRQGLSRQEAYRVVQELSFATRDSGASFREKALDSPALKSVLDSEEIARCFDIEATLANLDVVFERLKKAEVPSAPRCLESSPYR